MQKIQSVVGSLLREIDLNKKQTDSDFIKSLRSQPIKEFEIQKRLDRLQGIKRFSKNNNNNNNDDSDGGGSGGGDLFGLGTTTLQNKNTTFIPEVLNINEIFNPLPKEYDAQQRLNWQVPEVDDLLQQRLNNLRGISEAMLRVRPDETPFLLTTPLIFIFLPRPLVLIRRTNLTVGCERLIWFSSCNCNQRRKS